MNSNKIIEYARECLDTPFRHQGRVCGVGLDCAGVVVHVAHRLGLEITEAVGYSRNPGNGLLESAINSQQCVVEAQDKQPGDILLMKFKGEPQHLGIYTGTSIIHALWRVKKTTEHRIDEIWESRIAKVYRFTL